MKFPGFLQTIFGCVLLALLGMLYWSSLVVEEDLKALNIELKTLRTETTDLRKILREKEPLFRNSITHDEFHSRPHMDPTYPNLLEEDPYYTQILPSLLEKDFQPKGILQNAIIGRPDNLHPFNGFANVASFYELCTPRIAKLKVGKFETMTPDMAIKLEARPRPDQPEAFEYWVHLRDDVYWQPLNRAYFEGDLQLDPFFFEKHPVTAHDFKFFYDAVMNPYLSEAKAASLRTYYHDIESITVIDNYTFVVRWRPQRSVHEKEGSALKIKYTSLSLTGSLQPLPCFVYQYFADGQKIIEEEEEPDSYQTDSVWAQNFSRHWAKNYIVSCGSLVFEKMTDEGIFCRRNDEHYNPHAVLVEGIFYHFKESADAIWQDFKAGKLDLCTLPANRLLDQEVFLSSPEYGEQKASGKAIHAIDYVDLSYSYIGWNVTKPFFTSQKVRQALTMAIDRRRIVEQNLNEMAVPITGPFSCFSPSYDSSIPLWPYNPDESRRLLDEEGWIDTDRDGIRDRIIDGKTLPFRFKLCYFVKSLPAKVIAEYISTSLREVGVDCKLMGLDIADLSRELDDKSFDATFMGWKLGAPPEDPYQLWHSSGAHEKGSSNIVGLAEPEIDNIIEALSYEYDQQKRISLYHQLHGIIHEMAPYTFLYTPKVRLLYRDYVKNLFIPRDRQDLIPDADIPEPNTQLIWLAR